MKITFIQTGGSIDKDYPRSTMGYAFEITEPAVKRILEKLDPTFEYEIIPFIQKDSLDLTDDDREGILNTCKTISTRHIIITHGTDTMMETARYLSTIQDKVIILTGSFKPERFTISDAPVNIGVAIGAVQTLKTGVYIVMNGEIFKWNEVIRNPETGRFHGA